MSTVLWHIEISHYSEKVRWALDYKAVPHTRKTPLPGLHSPMAMVMTRSSHRRLPILDLGGRRVPDSTAIVAALEEQFPEPPLYPADPGERARALELEDYFDEELAPRVRRFVWIHTLDDTDAAVDSMLPDASRTRRRVMRTLLPVARPIVKRDYGVKAERADSTRSEILAVADRLERELQPSGYLAGDEFSVADLAAAALFTPVICPPGRQYTPPRFTAGVLELREELEGRPAGAWVHEMFARHRPGSAEIPH